MLPLISPAQGHGVAPPLTPPIFILNENVETETSELAPGTRRRGNRPPHSGHLRCSLNFDQHRDNPGRYTRPRPCVSRLSSSAKRLRPGLVWSSVFPVVFTQQELTTRMEQRPTKLFAQNRPGCHFIASFQRTAIAPAPTASGATSGGEVHRLTISSLPSSSISLAN